MLVSSLESKLTFHDQTRPLKSTATTRSQIETQDKYAVRIQHFVDNADVIGKSHLAREKHIAYCLKGLESLSSSYEGLDSSRPWLVFWTCHALSLLDYHFDTSQKNKITSFLALCQNASTGGFGGGPKQASHLATTYAALSALAIMGTDGYEEAYRVVDRDGMKRFLLSVKLDTGCFAMHVGGEGDTRAVYCACIIGAYLKFDFASDLYVDTVDYLTSCQSWDGGFGPNPGAESHGGYTFTSLASLTLLNKMGSIKRPDALIRWLTARQMTVEGGFSGRANKLVDSCYNYWQGASYPIVQNMLDPRYVDSKHWLCDELALHEYTLFGAQWADRTGYKGGFGDRPGAHRDYYHTCYALAGLSVMSWVYDDEGDVKEHNTGHTGGQVSMVNPIHNVRPIAVLDMYDFFKNNSVPANEN